MVRTNNDQPGETTAHPLFLSSFLEGPKAALVASKDFDNGHYKTIPQHGIRAFGRVYSAWAYGQTVIFSKIYSILPFSNSSTSVTVVQGTSVPSRWTVNRRSLSLFLYIFSTHSSIRNDIAILT
jgi:hypothetical protein